MAGRSRASRSVRLMAAAGSALAAVAGTSVLAVGAQAAPAASAATGTSKSQPVIVVLRTQFAPAREGTRAATARMTQVSSAQAPVLTALRAAGATHVRTYSLVNALAATVSGSELAKLKSDPEVTEVIPDVTISGPDPLAQPPASKSKPAGKYALTPNPIPGACSANNPQLEPEGLTLTRTASYQKSQPTARSLGISGAGVKVAWLGDGINVNNANLLRKNKTSVFFDFQDFSGDGPGQPTAGSLAYIDANTIAGQGQHTYNVQDFSAEPDTTACKIRIQGVAPGASLLGLDVFGENEDTTESSFLQALNYAVQTDHVNVLDESFSLNPFPDVSALDLTKQFNDAAAAAGVVVTVSSGDGGSANTIGSPASDPNVISVGASTDFRFYAQTNYAAAGYFATKGWLDNNASAAGSSGYYETGELINLVAPGDSSFASCDPTPEFASCENFQGQPSDVELSSGTEEASSFVAGAAALVIQAYRQTHGGATPTPALVKQILLSTATDLGTPTQEQGAGLLNSYKAVQLAESIATADGTPAPTGSTLLKSETNFSAVKAAGEAAYFKVKLTNTGAASQTVGISGRTLGPNQDGQHGSVTLTDGTSPEFLDSFGVPNNYQTFTFTVNPGANRLDASIAYPGDPFLGNLGSVSLILISPQGQFAGNSLPQGTGFFGAANFGNVDVANPAAGTWTGVIFGDIAAAGGTNGKVPWRAETQRYIRFGKFSAKSVTLAPGESRTIRFHETMPPQAGDRSGSVVFTSPQSGRTEIPVNLRTDVPFNGNLGTFRGTLTGGNGQEPGEGQVDYYEFKVGSGVSNITANLNLQNNLFEPVAVYLVNPEGEIGGYGENLSPNGITEAALTAYADDPVPGNWILIAEFSSPVDGNEVSQPFHGSIAFNQVSASAAGLPDNASITLPAGRPITVPLSITNNGSQAEQFFIDPRLTTETAIQLQPLDSATVPLPASGEPPFWFLPTHSASVAVSAVASLPIQFDYAPATGDPDLGSGPVGTSANGSYAPPAGDLTSGVWFADISESGPYRTAAPAGTATSSMSVQAREFDPAVTSPTEDVEQLGGSPNVPGPFVTINPGQTATINVTITPSAASGTVVSGTLYIDDLMNGVPPYEDLTADELTGIPYEYTVG